MPALSHEPYPVEATFDGHDWTSTGLDYGDMPAIHMVKRKACAGRRLEAPAWATNNSQLLRVILLYMEKLCLHRSHPLTGTPQQKLAMVIVMRLAMRSQYEATVTKLCKLYVAEKDPVRRKSLATEIKCLDCRLRNLGREHLNALGVVYRYWSLGEDSVAVANALGLTAVHVRVLLGRLQAVATKELWKPRISMRINLLPGLKYDPAAVAPKGQRRCWVCGIFFTPVSGQHKLCSAKCRKKRRSAIEKNRRAGKPVPPKYFCGPACKEAAKFVTHVLPVKFAPGVGCWCPTKAGPGYEGYKQFCIVIGATPLPEIEWRNGVQ